MAETLDSLRPDRLGHGVRCVEDPAVLERVVASGVALEVCPGSNVALGVYAEAADVPLRRLVDAGATVALGADDPVIFGSRLAEQYTTAREVHGIDDAGLAALAVGFAAGEPGAVRRGGGGRTGCRRLAASVRPAVRPVGAREARLGAPSEPIPEKPPPGTPSGDVRMLHLVSHPRCTPRRHPEARRHALGPDVSRVVVHRPKPPSHFSPE